jgi:uncharacterized protein
VIIITGEEGLQHGYQDRYRPAGVFEYFGEGQVGDMQLQRGNRAIPEHSVLGKSLLLFRKTADGVRFEGEMVYEGHHVERAPDRTGTDRNAIVFELRPLEAIAEIVEAEGPPPGAILGELRQRALSAAHPQYRATRLDHGPMALKRRTSQTGEQGPGAWLQGSARLSGQSSCLLLEACSSETAKEHLDGLLMRIDELPQSDRIEDRRGARSSLPGGRGGIGIGTVVVLGLIGWALGIDPSLLIGGAEMLSGGGTQQQTNVGSETKTGAPSDEIGRFVSAVLGSTETQWTEIFAKSGRSYKQPTLVMFSGATQSGCGFAQSAMGPFYCPLDQKVYLDTSFFQDLERRFRACDVGSKTCQFSQAYVIAHEIGHHVQNLLGLLPKVQEAQRGMGKIDANSLQVRVELQADCLAGVWANRAQAKWKFIESGDVEAAMQTASAIGDDRLQRQSQGYVVPDSFTHGSSAQRTHWFMTGLKSGEVASCDTFRAEQR